MEKSAVPLRYQMKNAKQKKFDWGKTINIAAVTLVAVFAILLILTKFSFSGFKIYVVTSGSMAPSIKQGALIVVKKSDNYKIGDIINYKIETNLLETVTHRLVRIEVSDNKTVYITKGDANNIEDNQKTTLEMINGRVVSNLPFAGFIIGFIQTGPGIILLIVIPATIIVYEEIINIKNEIAAWLKKRKANT